MTAMNDGLPRLAQVHTQEMATKLRDICVRASLDPEFRARVQRDPKGVMAEFGLKLTPGVHVVMVPATPEHLAAAFAGTTRETLRLPVIDRPESGDDVLEDSELEDVTGGAGDIGQQFADVPLENLIGNQLGTYFSHQFQNYQP